MDRVFEALERLAMPDDLHKQECERLGISLTEDYEIVKQYLLELNQIKESNPSEALKCLEKMIRDFNETTTGMNGLGEVVVGNELMYFHKKELETIEQALLKAQEQEKEKAGCAGGRNFNKEVLYLKQSIEQCNDKPIFYISRSFGNKYIVPQKEFEKLTSMIATLFEKKVELMSLFLSDSAEQYNNQFVNDENKLTDNEFDTLKKGFKLI